MTAGTLPQETKDKIKNLAKAWVLAKSEQAANGGPDYTWIQQVADSTQDKLALDQLLARFNEGETKKKERDNQIAALKSFCDNLPNLIEQLAKDSPGDGAALVDQEVQRLKKQDTTLDDTIKALEDLKEQLTPRPAVGAGGGGGGYGQKRV